MEKNIPKIIGAFINFIALFSPKYAAKLALQLFSTPRKGKLKASEAVFLKTAQHKDFQYTGFTIKTYKWSGTRSTILLAHGWESNAFRWKNLIELLSTKDYNIIALDAPAHGASGNKEFNAVLYSECINMVANYFKPNVIIGHSVGGMSTVFALNSFTINVERIILLGAPDAFISIFTNYENMMGYSKRTSNAIKNLIVKKFKHQPEHFSTSNFTSNLNIEGLIIHDKKDRIIPFNDAVKIHNKFKKAKLIETKGYGHGLKSKEVYNHILNFLNA
ncbi:alpha/beta hydrolase family protein [Jejuia pallidilutea]|uniref:Alpha/beta hydrolase family protein n=1 Tax=Jejuia pallidilutea TaxID=504487 RepID=A0A362X6S7_9FLAO|nr:alpha/beta hydrolase [Jejuia pallidilutea]PQV46606.1 alpha/beta hydrolase family protein [Jejuia pallidilutea]